MENTTLQGVRCISFDDWDDLLQDVREIRSLSYLIRLLLEEVQKHSVAGSELLNFALFHLDVAVDTLSDRSLGIDLMTRRYDLSVTEEKGESHKKTCLKQSGTDTKESKVS